MILDEAIKHAEEVAEEQNILSKRYDEASGHYRTHNEVWESHFAKNSLECFSCAEEHRQLAEWLTDYKRLKEQTTWIPVSERLPEDGNKNYLVCCDDGYIATIMYAGFGEWLIDNTKIVAWMPLPKPYKAD